MSLLRDQIHVFAPVNIILHKITPCYPSAPTLGSTQKVDERVPLEILVHLAPSHQQIFVQILSVCQALWHKAMSNTDTLRELTCKWFHYLIHSFLQELQG